MVYYDFFGEHIIFVTYNNIIYLHITELELISIGHINYSQQEVYIWNVNIQIYDS